LYYEDQMVNSEEDPPDYRNHHHHGRRHNRRPGMCVMRIKNLELRIKSMTQMRGTAIQVCRNLPRIRDTPLQGLQKHEPELGEGFAGGAET
jgi:hypothetical protein